MLSGLPRTNHRIWHQGDFLPRTKSTGVIISLRICHRSEHLSDSQRYSLSSATGSPYQKQRLYVARIELYRLVLLRSSPPPRLLCSRRLEAEKSMRDFQLLELGRPD